MSTPEALLRSLLRQRLELGERELVLARGTAAELSASLVPLAKPQRAVPPLPSNTSPGRRESPAVKVATPAAPPVTLPASLALLREETLGCTRCGLADSRKHVVFGEGNPAADLVVVGEAPGAEEDLTGRPFVGRAGKLLDLLLASTGFSRDDVFICNVLKCRPPGNRNPEAEEVAACSPFLLRQIELVNPRVILACGSYAAQTLLGSTASIGQLRGSLHELRGIPLVATYHPAALLRNGGWVRAAWGDLQRLRSVLDGSASDRI